MSTRTLASAIGSLLLVLGMVFGALVATSVVAAAKQVTLTVIDWLPSAYVADVNRVLETFTASRPNIRVQYMNIGGDPVQVAEKVSMMLATGTPPDIITVNEGWVMDLDLGKNAFVDLAPLMKRDNFGLEQLALRFYPETELGFLGGKRNTFPFFSSHYVMGFNKGLFDAAGLAHPPGRWEQDPTWTWTDAFQQYLRKLTIDKDGDGRTDCYGVSGLFQAWMPMMFGGRYLSDDGTTFIAASDPQTLDALAFEAEARAAGYVGGSLQSGSSAMGSIGSWDFRMFAEAMKENLGVAVLPRGSGSTIIGGPEGFRIFRDSQHVQEAWELVKYLAGKQGQIAYAIDTLGLVPLHRHPDVQARFVNRLASHVDKGEVMNMMASLNYRMSWYPIYVQNEFGTVWNSVILPAVNSVSQGKEAPRTAMDRITPPINAILQKNKGHALSFSYVGGSH